MMNSAKDRIANRISRFFYETPTVSHNDDDSSPVCRPLMPQAFPIIKDEISSPKRSTSSILSLLPTTCSAVGQKISSGIQDHLLSPSRSHSRSWKYKSFASKDVLLENSKVEEPETSSNCTSSVSKANVIEVSERSAKTTETTEELSSLKASSVLIPHLTEKSTFVTADLFDFLHSSLPNIVKGCQWVLLYSSMKHGISLRTLIRRSASVTGPCLLVVGDMQGAVFGGLLDSPLKPTIKRKYQGTNQTFVFTTIYGEPRLFRATGANRFYYLCLNEFLAFGGGGSFAICLEDDLLRGSSGPSETFGNLCLAHSENFELKNVELWGFTHSSRYLL
ncbi:oxidation resistance protein 1 isoform X2 [Phalaenopsis equestris]|uniref:oxidation resistance protein 1 isoform X2 n=1 Tax=Phalaenopsis equestris TaxID=78828 RepID=UPI0009E26E66|nr:oxidation resistance protein 1 isoform X2 [Phalaenopsis equestris]